MPAPTTSKPSRSLTAIIGDEGIVVVGVDPAYLHRVHLATGPPSWPWGAPPLPQRRAAPNCSSTASMQRARSTPTSSSVSVRSGAQKRKR